MSTHHIQQSIDLASHINEVATQTIKITEVMKEQQHEINDLKKDVSYAQMWITIFSIGLFIEMCIGFYRGV